MLGTNLNIVHERSQSRQRDSSQMTQAASFHIENDNVSFWEAIFREFDVIEHAEHAHRVRKV